MPGQSFEKVVRQLDVGANTAFKVWRLSPVLLAVGVALILAAAYGVFRLWEQNQDVILLTVGGLGRFAIITAATLALPQVVALIRYRQTIRTLGIKSAIGVVLAVLFKLHRAVFDPLFLCLGTLSRLKKLRS